MSDTALEFEDVTKSYGGRVVVSGVDLVIPSGTVTALLGSSGAGKSTLLRLAAGLEDLDRGKIQLGGRLLSSTRKTIAPEERRVGLVFQDFALFPHLTALENVRFGVSTLDKDQGRRLALDWLDRMALAERAQAYPHELSGGEQQRVAIARALAPQPDAILLDEPFSSLDPALREAARSSALVAIHDAGLPALFVTHDAQEAMRTADTLAVMSQGAILQCGSAAEIFNHPQSLDVAVALGPVNRLDTSESNCARLIAAAGGRPEIGAYAVREEHLRLDDTSGARAKVVFKAETGRDVFLRLKAGNHLLTAVAETGAEASVGDEVGLSIAKGALLTF
ncbi:MAG: ABC transporter ATP-binding protein, partial [Pseudomonadota bacterium]